MRDAKDLLELIQSIALSAVEASKPTAMEYGTVTSDDPLQITIDQKFILASAQLVVLQTAHNAKLAVGDVVLMAREQGGQRYIVHDKVAK